MDKLESDYAQMVRKLVKPGSEIASHMGAVEAHLMHMALGVAGESGELIDALKKYTIYGKPIDINNVIEELGDIEFYLEGIRFALNIKRETTLESNMAKLAKRYNTGTYTDQAAQARADKERDLHFE